MRRAHTLRIAVSSVLAVWVGGSSGCTHNYYYGYPAPASSTPTQVGQVCDVAPGTVVTQRFGQPTVVASAPASSPVLVSEPQATFSRLGSRFGWHRPDPEALATTKIEGGIDDAPVTR